MKKEDYFICPNCGEEVPVNAKRCPECGADDKTGWNEDAFHQGVAVSPEEDFDYEEVVKREQGKSGKIHMQIIAGILLIVFILFFVLRSLLF